MGVPRTRCTAEPDRPVLDLPGRWIPHHGQGVHQHHAPYPAKKAHRCSAQLVTLPSLPALQLAAGLVHLVPGDNHVHKFGPFELTRFTGTPVRRCLVTGCKDVSLDGD